MTGLRDTANELALVLTSFQMDPRTGQLINRAKKQLFAAADRIKALQAERDAAWGEAIEAAVQVVEAEREERRAGNQTDGLWTAAQKIRALHKGADDD